MPNSNPQQTTGCKKVKHEPGFHFFAELFRRMNKEKDIDKLKDVGGVRELAKALEVDFKYGLDTTLRAQHFLSIQERGEVFGKNALSAVEPRRSLYWTKITTILGLSFKEERDNLGWIDSVGIWFVVLFYLLTSCVLDLQLSWKQGEMNHENNVLHATVLRDGREQLIKSSELLVGDVLLLTRGISVAADGLLFVDDDLFINEEVVTGDSKPIKKTLLENPFCQSGTQVISGSGRMLVTAVGEDSELGQTMKMVSDSTNYGDEWAHKARAFYLARNWIAFCLGILSFCVLLIRWMVKKKGFPLDEISDKGPIQFSILAINITVVELPVGICLSMYFGYIFLSWKLVKDRIYTRTPDVLGGMVGVSNICFDKTGTLTENKMTVVKGWFHGRYFNQLPTPEQFNPTTLGLIIENACLNSKAVLKTEEDGSIRFVGNQTECALIVMIHIFGGDCIEVRLKNRQHMIKEYGFNSDEKMSSIIIKQGDLLRLYNKGAAEMILSKCTENIDPLGSRHPITELKRIELEDTIDTMASEGLRTLALTYADLDPNEFSFHENGEPIDESIDSKRGFAEVPNENLVLLAIVGIRDPIRDGAVEVVEQLKKVGIVPRLITGDHIDVAKQVARECGILTDGFAIKGVDFRRMVEEDVEGLKRVLPKLQVLARSSPSDKRRFVELLKSLDEMVAVSGDGTNDVQAMKESDFAIAMGTDSTRFAREAADVVIMNDNISSILTFYLWSKCYWLNVCAYYFFRRGVSIMILTMLVYICVGGETFLEVHQLLWANVVINILIVLTFATESPPSKVLIDNVYQAKEAPFDYEWSMFHTGYQLYYQIIVITCTLYCLSSLFERYDAPAKDEFYYSYCYEDLTASTGYRHSPVGPFCDQYLNCSHSTRNCALFEEQTLDKDGTGHDFIEHISSEYEDEHDMVKMRKNSLLFNLFIFMQLFESLNWRRAFKRHNIVERLLNSPLSCVIRIVTIGMHLMIMLTPIRNLFNVTELNAWEWLYSLAMSVVLIPLTTLTNYMYRGARKTGHLDVFVSFEKLLEKYGFLRGIFPRNPMCNQAKASSLFMRIARPPVKNYPTTLSSSDSH